jgi:hypothetical protein
VGEQVELHAGDKLIEVYFHHQRIATHVRKFYPGMTTEPGHMPEQHAQHQQWTPGRLMNWAQSIGPEVLVWVKEQLQRKDHPEQAYRVCLGLLSLNRTYPAERLNQACAIANKEALFKLKNVKATSKAIGISCRKHRRCSFRYCLRTMKTFVAQRVSTNP